MNIIVCSDYHAVCQKAAEYFLRLLADKKNAVFGLATGSTPLGLYRELIAAYHNGQADFSQAVTFNLDEYVGLSAAHPQSYHHYMKENLFSHINILPENTHLPDGSALDPHAEAIRYEMCLRSFGGVDLQLLGLGMNGHIAFNEPSDCFPTATHLTDLDASTVIANARFFDTVDDVPKQAITMGIGSIFSAKKILLLVCGGAKADILAAAVNGPVTPAVPASILQFHPNVTILCDREAAAAL